jgi:hypothetical protein
MQTGEPSCLTFWRVGSSGNKLEDVLLRCAPRMMIVTGVIWTTGWAPEVASGGFGRDRKRGKGWLEGIFAYLLAWAMTF